MAYHINSKKEFKELAYDLELLQKLSLFINSNLNEDELAQQIVDTISEQSLAKESPDLIIAVLYKYIKKKNILSLHKVTRNEIADNGQKFFSKPFKKRVIPLDGSNKSGLYQCYHQKKIIICQKSEQMVGKNTINAKDPPEFLKKWGIRSYIAIPLIIRDSTIGVLQISTKFHNNKIPQRILNNLKIYAKQSAVSLQNAHLYTESIKHAYSLEQKTRDLTRLENSARLISETLDYQAVSQKIVNILSQNTHSGSDIHMEINHAMLYSINIAQKKFSLITMSSNDVSRQLIKLYGNNFKKQEISYIKPPGSLFAKAYRRATPQITSNLSELLGRNINNKKEQLLKKNWGTQSYLLLPLRHEKKVLGALQVSTIYSPTDIPKRLIEHLQSFASHSAIALENAQYLDKIEEQNHQLTILNHKLQQLDKAKNNFLSIASHQLRTPLAAIRGYLHLLENGDFGDLNSTQHQTIKKLESNANRLVTLVNDLLSLSRIESEAHRELNLTRQDLNHIIQEVYEETTLTAQEKGIQLKWQPHQKPLHLHCDRSQLKQIIMNLVDNAIYYTPKGSVTISCTTDDQHLTLKIKDTGIGIDKKSQTKMFTKFFRSESAKKIRPDGTGIGMYVVKMLIKSHQGQIWFESKARRGTTFFVKIPLHHQKSIKKN